MLRIYSNRARVFSNDFEVEVRLSRKINLDQTPPGTEPAEIDVVSVVMSPQHAKSLLLVLGNCVDAYEERFGKMFQVGNAQIYSGDKQVN